MSEVVRGLHATRYMDTMEAASQMCERRLPSACLFVTFNPPCVSLRQTAAIAPIRGVERLGSSHAIDGVRPPSNLVKKIPALDSLCLCVFRNEIQLQLRAAVLLAWGGGGSMDGSHAQHEGRRTRV